MTRYLTNRNGEPEIFTPVSLAKQQVDNNKLWTRCELVRSLTLCQ